jgi:SAM-dependent MidA family methyltransferase
MDYGENQGFSDSVRGIRNHKFVKNFLDYPGEVDISAYVNFLSLNESASKAKDIICKGPMP